MKKAYFLAASLLLTASCGGSGTAVKAGPRPLGNFTDPRDGHVYNLVEINNQTWMSQNMAFAAVEHVSANADSANDGKYGFLYPLGSAVNVCPPGWTLPSVADYEAMMTALCGKAQNEKPPLEGTFYKNCMKKMDKAGFNSLLAGDYYGGLPMEFNENGQFWTADLLQGGFGIVLFHSPDKSFLGDIHGDHHSSVRCIKVK